MTRSDYSTETPGSNKLTRRRGLSKLQPSPLNGTSNHRPLSPGPVSCFLHLVLPTLTLVQSPNGHGPTLVSVSGRNGAITYPAVSTPFSPPPGTEPTPPQAASVNQYPISRKRSDYADQGQQAYAGSAHTARPIDYPQLSSQNVLSPPPAAATMATIATNRLEPRNRLTHSSGSYSPVSPGPMSAPIIKSDYPVVYWGNNEIGMSGLKNLGNTCYMNSVLQCLSAAAPFARFFIGESFSQTSWGCLLT